MFCICLQVESFFFFLELALFLKMLFVLEANSDSFQHGLTCFLLVSEQPKDPFTFHHFLDFLHLY